MAEQKDVLDKARLLIVDDDEDMLKLLVRWLNAEGAASVTAKSGRQALEKFEDERPDAVVTDLVMDDMDGLRLLTEVHRRDPIMPVIMVSGQAEIADAMKAAHLGVSAFLTKPLEKKSLISQVADALRLSGVRRADRDDGFGAGIVYRSAPMEDLLERARLVASVDSTVLISGDTGTGKELLARAIHGGSPRKDAPFVSVNCSAIPEQLLESELFGHEKGAFSGATNRHDGLFRSAHGGTIFLDEIGDMPVALQSKLLRVLQDFEVRPVGSTTSFPIDVRVISATHKDLEAAIDKGEFREDLYYRLSVVPLHMPSLEERREDILAIAEQLLITLCERHGLKKKHLSPDARQTLASAAWPGNVRQLGNVIEQCAVLCRTDVISGELVKTALRQRPGEIAPLDEAKRAFERDYLIGVLRITEGQVSNAARLAGRNRTDFYKLLNKHGLEAADYRVKS
ncbi:MAG: sigma 54-interacting transcriptional regulator [Gammaproteobacteria bacterium]|nr:sigma 54-interacting transcriptional regulator [Gammaproteobacteria bacterium]